MRWNLSTSSLYPLCPVFSSVLFVAVLCILGYCDEVSPNFLYSRVRWCSSFSLFSEDRFSSPWVIFLDSFGPFPVCPYLSWIVGTRTGCRASSVAWKVEWEHKVGNFRNLHHHCRGWNWDTKCMEFSIEVDISTAPGFLPFFSKRKVHKQT